MDLPLNILNLDLPQGPDIKEPAIKKEENTPLPALRITTEKRRGKWVTIIWADKQLTEQQADELAKLLKQKLAVGGSTRNGEILLQGNIKEKAILTIRQLGHRI